MADLNMYGPYDFSSYKIDEMVTEKSPGNYALGYVNLQDTFIVKYVGRSDSDVNKELKARLSWSKYKKLKFSYLNSAKEAFEKECRNYHDFGGNEKLDNEKHPDRPDGNFWKCPICTIFD